MRRLLDLKQVRIKQKNSLLTVFSSIREPLFTKSPGPNFQDRLFDWWKEVSNNFNKTAEEYVLMKS